jgi:hypothetical protein
VGHVSDEDVTIERAILFRKEIVSFRACVDSKIETEHKWRRLGEFKNWRAVRAGQRLAGAAHKTVIPIPDHLHGRRAFLCRSTCRGPADLRFGHSHCALCRGATGSTRKVTYGAWCPDKMSPHRRSSNTARTSASFAASGSRDRADQRHVLSQEEAAGSSSTVAIFGSSPEFVVTPRLLLYS